MTLGIQQLMGGRVMGVTQQSLVPGNTEIMWVCSIGKFLCLGQGVGGGGPWLDIALAL